MLTAAVEHVGLDIMDFWAAGKQCYECILLLPLHLLSPCHSVGWQETCQMCQSHMKCMTLVSPDLVAPRLTVKSETQTNPKGNDEGPTQTIKDCRTGPSVFVYSVIFKLEKTPVITTKLLNSLLCIAILLYLLAACAC